MNVFDHARPQTPADIGAPSYETGIWTPNIVLQSATVPHTYTVKNAVYTRVGNLWTANCQVQFANPGAGLVYYFAGLPMVAGADAVGSVLISSMGASASTGWVYLLPQGYSNLSIQRTTTHGVDTLGPAHIVALTTLTLTVTAIGG